MILLATLLALSVFSQEHLSPRVYQITECDKSCKDVVHDCLELASDKCKRTCAREILESDSDNALTISDWFDCYQECVMDVGIDCFIQGGKCLSDCKDTISSSGQNSRPPKPESKDTNKTREWGRDFIGQSADFAFLSELANSEMSPNPSTARTRQSKQVRTDYDFDGFEDGYGGPFGGYGRYDDDYRFNRGYPPSGGYNGYGYGGYSGYNGYSGYRNRGFYNGGYPGYGYGLAGCHSENCTEQQMPPDNTTMSRTPDSMETSSSSSPSTNPTGTPSSASGLQMAMDYNTGYEDRSFRTVRGGRSYRGGMPYGYGNTAYGYGYPQCGYGTNCYTPGYGAYGYTQPYGMYPGATYGVPPYSSSAVVGYPLSSVSSFYPGGYGYGGYSNQYGSGYGYGNAGYAGSGGYGSYPAYGGYSGGGFEGGYQSGYGSSYATGGNGFFSETSGPLSQSGYSYGGYPSMQYQSDQRSTRFSSQMPPVTNTRTTSQPTYQADTNAYASSSSYNTPPMPPQRMMQNYPPTATYRGYPTRMMRNNMRNTRFTQSQPCPPYSY